MCCDSAYTADTDSRLYFPRECQVTFALWTTWALNLVVLRQQICAVECIETEGRQWERMLLIEPVSDWNWILNVIQALVTFALFI